MANSIFSERNFCSEQKYSAWMTGSEDGTDTCSNEKANGSDHKSEKLLSLLIVIFSFFGVNVSTTSKGKKIFCIANVLGWFGWTVACCGLILKYVFDESEGSRFKLLISTQVRDFLILALWVVLWYIRKSTCLAFANVMKLARNTGVKVPVKCLTVYLSAIAVALFYCIRIGAMDYEENGYQTTFNTLKLISLRLPNWVLLLIYSVKFIITDLFFTVFSLCFLFYYFILCQYISNIISSYTHWNLAKISSSKLESGHLEKCLRFYESITQILKAAEDSTSLPIFLLFTNLVINAFSCTLITFKKKELEEEIVLSETACVTPAYICFVFLCLLPARVNEADKAARQANERILYLSAVGETKSELETFLNFSFMNNKPAFVFSGWGFFYFTKDFFLSTIGCIITYMLLVITL